MRVRTRQTGAPRPEPASELPLPLERMRQFRFMLVALGLTAWGLVVVLRLVQVQVFEHREYRVRAARQSERTINLASRRGAILDRHGRQLAVSVDAESVHADPQSVRDADAAAVALARALRLDAGDRRDLAVRLRRDRAFVWVKRMVDPAQAQAVRSLELDGIGFLTENRRYYPKRELAAQVIGYTGIDNNGMWGLEYALDEQIRGRAAKVIVRTDARRRPVGHTERPSTDGHTVVLTLDEAVQYVAERELDRAVNETRSIAGVAVVVAPRTGEILAMASRPTFNPNTFLSADSRQWRNRAVVDAYEPGSIFKVVTAAAALEENVVSPDEVLDCGNGFIEVAGQRIDDPTPYDRLRFRDVLAKSSDVGMVRVAQRLGRENLDRYVRAFGFGAPTGVGLPGESGGLLRPLSRWSPLSLASISFGQEIGVTALQMTMAMAAVANGGYVMRPLIVRRIEDGSGNVVVEHQPAVVRRVIRAETAERLTRLLEGVVREGTGKLAAIPGYVVAGKTGTAQKVEANGRYSLEDHVASFVGYAPASRPEIVVLVSLDTPRGERNQGGDVAAPVFARIAEQALRRLAVPPDEPSLLIRVARGEGLERPVSYDGALARPRLAPFAPRRPSSGPELMPDLRGHSAREAAAAAVGLGLLVQLHGTGRVLAQRPEPGAEVAPGVICVLTLGRRREPLAPERSGEGT